MADYYTVMDLAVRFGVNPRTITRWIGEGKVTAHKMGSERTNRWFIPKDQPFFKEDYGRK